MRLYMRYLGIHLRSMMQYKASFYMLTLGQFLTTFSSLLVVYFLFSRFGAVKGFGLEEVLICYSVVLMAFSLAECFARGFDTFPRLISNGQFDRMLVRPRNATFQVLASTVEITRVGRMVQAVAVLAYAAPNSGIAWTAGKVAVLAFMILGGTALFAALFWMYAGLSFFTLEGLEFMNVFTDGAREFAAYPLDVYGTAILKFCTYIVPYALFQYYPLTYLLGRKGSPLCALAPLAAPLFALPCWIVWRVGVRKYQSAGS